MLPARAPHLPYLGHPPRSGRTIQEAPTSSPTWLKGTQPAKAQRPERTVELTGTHWGSPLPVIHSEPSTAHWKCVPNVKPSDQRLGVELELAFVE
eukprot:2949144-Pyramimonas_sp.AAC.1